MGKADQVKKCIEMAIRRESKLTPLAIDIPALSSLNIRHLMNNLGSISTYYLDIGIHRGGLFCSTLCKNGNLKMAFAIDNWATDELNGENNRIDFESNLAMIRPHNISVAIYHCDAFPNIKDGDRIPRPIDLYLYDAAHDEESQHKALTYWIDSMADEFIFCVDDYDWEDVQMGTKRAIDELRLDVIFEQTFKGNDHDNDGWWNGFGVFILKKKV